jgi:molybdenum cofactor cytidylyltransferase
MVFLGDQPMVSTEVCAKIISEYKKTGKGIVIPSFNNKRGHPVLIDIKYRNDIFNLNPDIGLRDLMAIHPDDIKEVDIKNRDILKDIDTLNDYLEAIN